MIKLMIKVTLMIKFMIKAMIKAMIESVARITTVRGKHRGKFRRAACTLHVSLSKQHPPPRCRYTRFHRCKYKSWAGVGDCIGCVAGKYLSTEGNDDHTIALFPHPTFHDRRRRAQDRRDAATGEECDDGNSQDGDVLY